MDGKRLSVRLLVQTDRVIRLSLVASLILMLVQFIFLLIYWTRIPPEVPLYYSLPAGAARLAPKNHLLVLPLLSILTWLSSFFLIRLSDAFFIYRRLIVWFANVTIVLLLIATVLLTYLVF